MRLKEREFRARVGDLDVAWSHESISAHQAGMEIHRVLHSIDLAGRLRSALRPEGLDGDNGVGGIVFALPH